MEKASGKNLEQFFKQWLYQPTNPVVQADWQYDANQKKLRVVLSQTQSGNMIFDLPLEIAYYTKDNPKANIMKLAFNKQQQTFELDTKAPVKKLVVDPNNILLATINFKQ